MTVSDLAKQAQARKAAFLAKMAPLPPHMAGDPELRVGLANIGGSLTVVVASPSHPPMVADADTHQWHSLLPTAGVVTLPQKRLIT